MPSAPPRIVIAATGGDGGKTLLSLGLISAFRARGLTVSPYKKGPDYIDAAWLSLAAGRPTRNLDTFLMGSDGILEGFRRGIDSTDLAVIEGNRGLYDGMDAQGTHSTATLARQLGAPVLLVLDATKVTRTLAAVVLGCKTLEPDVTLAAVVLICVATARHEQVARQAIEEATGIPVVGAVARRRGGGPLPDRHLGLVTPEEHERAREAVATAGEMIERGVDLDAVLRLARSAPSLPIEAASEDTSVEPSTTIGVVRDSAFCFYYPENLKALEAAGARLLQISSLESESLPAEIDGLYIGGGFPETHAPQLARNSALLSSIKRRAEAGLPVYAECGGLMLLSRSLEWREKTYPMAGVLPVDVAVKPRPQGHGYCVVEVDRSNPFFDVGTSLEGHEFHYSTVVSADENTSTAYAVKRGAGCFDNRDGLVYKNVLASYAHLHALGVPNWGRGLVRRAREHRRTRTGKRQTDSVDQL